MIDNDEDDTAQAKGNGQAFHVTNWGFTAVNGGNLKFVVSPRSIAEHHGSTKQPSLGIKHDIITHDPTDRPRLTKHDETYFRASHCQVRDFSTQMNHN